MGKRRHSNLEEGIYLAGMLLAEVAVLVVPEKIFSQTPRPLPGINTLSLYPDLPVAGIS